MTIKPIDTGMKQPLPTKQQHTTKKKQSDGTEFLAMYNKLKGEVK